MAEEEKPEENIEEGTPPKKEEKKEEDPIKKAEGILKGITEQNERFEKNISEMRKFAAEEMLEGRSMAAKQKSREEKEKEEALKLVEGTGLNPFE